MQTAWAVVVSCAVLAHISEAGSDHTVTNIPRSRIVSSSLRGGQQVQTDATTTPKYMSNLAKNRLIAQESDDEDDISTVKMSPWKMKQLDLQTGDVIRIRGSRQRDTLAVVEEARKIQKGNIAIPYPIRKNIYIGAGDLTTVYPDTPVEEGTRVVILPYEDTVDGFEGDIFETFLEPHFAGAGLPVRQGDKFKLTAEGRTMEFKIVEVETEGGEEYCILGDSTELTVEGDPLDRGDEPMEEAMYADIGGCQDKLAQIRELVELPLRHPELFSKLGIKPPRGVLMHGPPGCGKTMIARAVAAETGAYLKLLHGPEVMSKQSGESEGNLRKAFDEAEANAPAIIFIDEIDALAPKREKSQGETEKRIVSQLLTLMDGLKPTAHVVVIAATNRPNVIDPALRRFGRFDRELDIGVPTEQGRYEILKIKTKEMKLAKEMSEVGGLEQVAEDTHGYCGADLAQICSEAAMQCVREQTHRVDIEDDEVDPELLESLAVSPQHFEHALSKSAPSSLRDKAVEIPDCGWEDVGGLLDVKRELMETIQYPVKYANKFLKFGMQPSKGVLLYGPSGCGKTLCARAIANECKSNFLSIKGPELLSMWFGESEANVRNLFDKARAAAPCILFFDEIDSIAKPRGSGVGGNDAGDRIVNQILTEIDGVGAKKSLFIIAATNRPDMLDSAVCRPGRLDQLIYLPLPDHACRVKILESATRKSPLAPDVKLEEIADVTEGFSGADLTEICQRSCKLAIRSDIKDAVAGKEMGDAETRVITKEHFEIAMTFARKSVTQAEIKKFTAFQAKMAGNK